MTEKQLDISDAMLKYLATHENRVNRSTLTRALKEQFKVAGKAIGVIASIAAILSFFLGLLF